MDEYVKQQEKIKIEAQKQKDKEYLNSKIKKKKNLILWIICGIINLFGLFL